MGMEVVYRRLSETEFQAIQEDPQKSFSVMASGLPRLDSYSISELREKPELLKSKREESRAALRSRQNDPCRFDLQKEWHALHFLLTGESATDSKHGADFPLHNLVMGGHESNIESSHGPARYFQVEEVKFMADALKKLSVEELQSRFSAEAFNKGEIYPFHPGCWTIEGIKGLLTMFPKLVQFVEDASVSGQVVVVYAE